MTSLDAAESLLVRSWPQGCDHPDVWLRERAQMKNDAIRNTQTELESLNEELLDLKETLDEERVSMMATVQQYHAKKRDLDDEREDFQDQRTELEEAISMEKEGLTALRKQAAEYQTLVDIEKRDMGALPSAGGGVSFHRKGDRSPTRESAVSEGLLLGSFVFRGG